MAGNHPTRRSGIAWCSLGISSLLSACSTLAPQETPLPIGAVQVQSSAVYFDWYTKTEACSGVAQDFSTVKFYVVPGVETFSTSDGQKVGEWISDGRTNRVVIAGNYKDHEMVVRHELLHSLLQQEGHPQEFFVNRCKLTWETWGGTIGTGSAGAGD